MCIKGCILMRLGVKCVMLMLTVAPIVACSTVVCLDPLRWGGSINPLAIVFMALFGLVSTPLWPTYIPALIIVPLLMRIVASRQFFMSIQLSVLILVSMVIGGIAGIVVLIHPILMSLNESKMATSWAVAGFLAGSITFSLIVAMYRKGDGRSGKTPRDRPI